MSMPNIAARKHESDAIHGEKSFLRNLDVLAEMHDLIARKDRKKLEWATCSGGIVRAWS